MMGYASLQALVQAQGIQMGRPLVTTGSSIVLVQLQHTVAKARHLHEAMNSARWRRRGTQLLSNEKPHSEGKGRKTTHISQRILQYLQAKNV